MPQSQQIMAIMPQTQQIISINLWQIVISLCNLCVLTLIVKRFLYKPVKRVLDQRQARIDGEYAQADEARRKAEQDQAEWAERMTHAREEADGIVKQASESAAHSTGVILADARAQADGIVRQAREEARLTQLQAQEGIRRELAGVSTQLAEKLLGREINERDHRSLIDSFIEEMGDDSESDQ